MSETVLEFRDLRKSFGGSPVLEGIGATFVPQRDDLLDNSTGKRYLGLIADFYPRWKPCRWYWPSSSALSCCATSSASTGAR